MQKNNHPPKEYFAVIGMDDACGVNIPVEWPQAVTVYSEADAIEAFKEMGIPVQRLYTRCNQAEEDAVY